MYFVGIIYGLLPISGILFSYYKIISSFLRTQLSDGKYKAFSTCGSHLSCWPVLWNLPRSVWCLSCIAFSKKHSVSSVIFTVVIPMMKPLHLQPEKKDIKITMRQLHRSAIWYQLLWCPSGK
jgi:olfactory receptor